MDKNRHSYLRKSLRFHDHRSAHEVVQGPVIEGKQNKFNEDHPEQGPYEDPNEGRPLAGKGYDLAEGEPFSRAAAEDRFEEQVIDHQDGIEEPGKIIGGMMPIKNVPVV